MTDRNHLAAAFLAISGWNDAEVTPLAGDASNRKYFRVRKAKNKPDAVLMDAPQERGEDVRPFIKIARHLSAIKLSAPELYAEDIDHGFLLLEDLGDDLYSNLCSTHPDMETELYRVAADALIALHMAPPPQLEVYSPKLMAELAAESVDWYALSHEGGARSETRQVLSAALKAALDPLAADFSVPILRDYHAQNLLWLPTRSGPARVGLLDFQDAMIGHPTYDLVSLLEDARRDVSPKTQDAVLTYFIEATDADPDRARAAYAAMGAQRNLRILMVFARLSLHFGKPSYVDLIPRTWAHLQRNLSHPHLFDVLEAVKSALPEPTESHLAELKEKCGTRPTR